jgi:hypothetical protein
MQYSNTVFSKVAQCLLKEFLVAILGVEVAMTLYPD